MPSLIENNGAEFITQLLASKVFWNKKSEISPKQEEEFAILKKTKEGQQSQHTSNRTATPTTTFTDSIFENFSNLRLRFLVSTFQRRIHGAVFLPDSDFVICDTVSATVLVILRRSRFLQFVSPLTLATWGYSVEACPGVPGPASAYCGDLLGMCEWLAIFGSVSHLFLVSHGSSLGVAV